MPTSDKPRKARSSSKHDVEPGQIWLDLTALHHNCCSLVQSGTTAAPILKDPTFIENAEHLTEVTATAKAIAGKLPAYLERLQNIYKNAQLYRAKWDSLNEMRRTASKERDLEKVSLYRSQMDDVEFSALNIGEGYQSWIADWQQDVNVDIIKLLNLIELTRQAMEKKHAAE